MHYLVWYLADEYTHSKLCGIFEHLHEANNYAKHRAGDKYIRNHNPDDGTQTFVLTNNDMWYTEMVGYGPMDE